MWRIPLKVSYSFIDILKAFRFSENLADLFFLLLRHTFSSIAYVRLVNFNTEKRKKKEQKIRKLRYFEYGCQLSFYEREHPFVCTVFYTASLTCIIDLLYT
jgi:hypothetical protein